MKIPYCRAKDKDSDRVIEGFYFSFPETTYCFTEDYERNPVKTIHCICTYSMTDWCLPNHPQLCTIDKSTLEVIGYYDTDEDIYDNGRHMNKEF